MAGERAFGAEGERVFLRFVAGEVGVDGIFRQNEASFSVGDANFSDVEASGGLVGFGFASLGLGLAELFKRATNWRERRCTFS